jgi:hypothetical protein
MTDGTPQAQAEPTTAKPASPATTDAPAPDPTTAPEEPDRSPVEQAPKKLSTKDKIKRSKRPTRVVEICLQTDLQEQHEALHKELAEAYAAEQNDKRLNSGGRSRQIALQIEALEQEMAEYVLLFRLTAISPTAWSDLQDEHPPREGNNDDLLLGYNPQTFFDAAIRACTVEPSDMDDEAWLDLLGWPNDEAQDGGKPDSSKADGTEDEEEEEEEQGDGSGKLTPKQYSDLQGAVMALNVRKVSLPNSYAASRILRGGEPE